MICGLSFSSIGDFLVSPIGCDYYFYLKIIFALFIVIAWTLYKVEKSTIPGGGDLMSCLAISSIAMIILSVFGTWVVNSQGIPMIQSEILLYVLAVGIPIILIWLFKD